LLGAARRGEHVAKARVFPLLRVVEAVEIEVPGREPGQLIRLHHGIGGALDAALHTERMQQVAHEARLAGAQRAVQLDEGTPHGRVGRKPLGAGRTGGLIRPHVIGSF